MWYCKRNCKKKLAFPFLILESIWMLFWNRLSKSVRIMNPFVLLILEYFPFV